MSVDAIDSVAGAVPRPGSPMQISRRGSTVVVTIRSQLDSAGVASLRHILGDLIDGQGNLFVAIEMVDRLAVDPLILDVLSEAGVRAPV